MTQLRRNHEARDKRGFSGFVIRSVFFVIFLVLLLFLLYKFIVSNSDAQWETRQPRENQTEVAAGGKVNPEDRFYLPEGSDGQVVHHSYYSLAYNDDTEQADWVAYKLTEKELRLPNVKRAKRFSPDKAVKKKSAYHKDYSHSGYTRGHMAPAGDMAFNETAMKETFYMSNMSPQVRECNGGIWRELEETVRDWAYDDDELYIVSGPLFSEKHKEKIGRTGVRVPTEFYKIILDVKGRETKSIAFIIPNEKSSYHLDTYAVSIDEVEKRTGFDFFPKLLDDEEEEELESNFDTKDWKFDKSRFKQRTKSWNKS